MKLQRMFIAFAVGLPLVTAGIALSSSDHASHSGLTRLGKVTFPVSCSPAAQKEFEVAMAYCHSFAWPELKASLDRVLQADPTCAMAHWGRALGYLDSSCCSRRGAC